MDPLVLTIVLRAVERVLVVGAGALAIWLGYRLFLSMPERDRSSGKLELPGGISIYLSRVGPGAFFSLFGAVVIGLSFHYGVSYSSLPGGAATGPAAVTAGEGAALATAAIEPVAAGTQYSGVGAASGAVDPLQAEAERASALLAIRNLNRGQSALRPDLPARDRIDIEQAILEAKLRLLGSVWDAERWGAFAAMRDWVLRGESDPPPVALIEPVGYFRAGTAP